MEDHITPTATERLLSYAREKGLIRSRELAALGFHRAQLRRLAARGLLIRIGRGIYMPADADITEQHTLAELAKRVPQGVVCLLSALRFHDLTTQSPGEVWLAIGIKARRPQVSPLPVRIVRFSDVLLEAGVEMHQVEGVAVRVTCPARTVVDCFKYRNKIGLDVALEALRHCWRERRCTMEELWRYAILARMTNVMRPYLESLT